MFKNVNLDVVCNGFEDELRKIAAVKHAGSTKAILGLGAAGGIVGYEALRRAAADRRLGAAMRKQQNQGY